MDTAVQGHLELLNDPVAQELLHAPIPARVAYAWFDGTPRVVPIWFDWNGEEIVVVSPPDAPKIQALQKHPFVTLSIDGTTWPYKVLQVRGNARIEIVDGIPTEYANAARRYFGEEQGAEWVKMVSGMIDKMARVAVRPEWVGILDFETRFPSALARRMG
jgi:hypothetical protein